MIDLRDLLRQAEAAGIHLWLTGEGKVRYRAPTTPEAKRIVEGLRQHRDAIRAMLLGDAPEHAIVPIERLRDFLAEHGLEVVGGGWPDGEERPILWTRRNGHGRGGVA